MNRNKLFKILGITIASATVIGTSIKVAEYSKSSQQNLMYGAVANISESEIDTTINSETSIEFDENGDIVVTTEATESEPDFEEYRYQTDLYAPAAYFESETNIVDDKESETKFDDSESLVSEDESFIEQLPNAIPEEYNQYHVEYGVSVDYGVESVFIDN
jgi:hypothetical protein